MRIESVSLENFGSYKKEQFVLQDFDDDEPVLIVGENRDSAGANSNGSGKSTLLHAICWALFGKLPTKGSADSVVREGESSCRVSVRLQVNGKEIDVIRGRGKHKGLTWSINGAIKKFSTNRDSQSALLRELGFHAKNAFDDFVNSSYFSTEAAAAFTSRNGSAEERMAIIARFLGLDVLDKAKDIARAQRAEGKGQLRALEENVQQFEVEKDPEALERAEKRIEEVQAQVIEKTEALEEISKEIKRAQKRDALQSKLEVKEAELEGIDRKYERLSEQLQEQIQSKSLRLGPLADRFEEMTGTIEEAEMVELEFLEDSQSQLEEAIAKLTKRSFKLGSRIKNQQELCARLGAQIEKAIPCPKCDTPLQVSVDGDIEHFDKDAMQATLERERREANTLSERRGKVETEIKEFKEALNHVKSQIVETRELEKIIEKQQQLRLAIEEATAEVDQLIEQRNGLAGKKHEEALELQEEVRVLGEDLETFSGIAETSSLIDSQSTINVAIRTLSASLKDAEATVTKQQLINDRLKKAKIRLKAMKAKYAGYEFWADAFPIIRKWQIDRFIPEFEGAVNRILSQMDAGMRVELSTVKERKSSRVDEDTRRAQFNLRVFSDTGQEREFESFSMGESRRIGMAVSFALRETTLNRGTNRLELLMIDELVDSLDELGMEAFFRLLPSLTGLKLVISHDPALASRFNSVVRVVKEEGVSRIA